VTPSSVSVDGLGDALVTVQLDLDEPRGTAEGVRAGLWLPDPRAPLGTATVSLAEVPGTRSGSSATFRGSWLVGSTRAGTYAVNFVSWAWSGSLGLDDGVDLRSTPTAGRQVVVTATHVPTLGVRLIPPTVLIGR